MSKDKEQKSYIAKNEILKSGRVTRPKPWPDAPPTPELKPKPQPQQQPRVDNSDAPRAPENRPKKD